MNTNVYVQECNCTDTFISSNNSTSLTFVVESSVFLFIFVGILLMETYIVFLDAFLVISYGVISSQWDRWCFNCAEDNKK